MPHMCMAYRGTDATALYSAYFDGSQWYGDARIEDQPGGISPRSDRNPGVCLYNNRLYLVYKGESSTELRMAWYDGNQWGGNVKINEMPGGINPESSDSPSLVELDSRIWAIYKGKDTSDIYAAFFDGTTWSGNYNLSVEARLVGIGERLDAVVFNECLYLVRKAPGSTDFYVSWLDDTGWDGSPMIKDLPGKISPRSNHNPATVVFQGRLYLLYKGADSDALYVAWFDGTTWGGNVKISTQPGKISPQSSDAPRALVFNNRIYMVYRGESSDDLYSAWFDGSTWGGNTKIRDQPTGVSPRCDYGPDLAFFPLAPPSRSGWLGGISDTTPICEINLPGTHDSAAFNTVVTTLYACHNSSITAQLASGVRLLDIRLQVVASGTGYTFMTCHGDVGSSLGFNQYQSFVSVLDECTRFLGTYPTEFIAMSLKIDDWSGVGDTQGVYDALKKVVGGYPACYTSSEMPLLRAVRGRIYLLNRVNDDLALGVPVAVPFNTSGAWLAADKHREFSVYVQDQFKGLPTYDSRGAKLKLFTDALSATEYGQLLLNFASATYYELSGVYIMLPLLQWFGDGTADLRPTRLGWSLFDYEDTGYQTNNYGFVNVVQFIVSSNFGYSGYESWFRVVGNGKDEL